MQSLQAFVDSGEQTAHHAHPQDIHSCRVSLAISTAHHRQQLEDEVGKLRRLHLLQVIHKHLLLQCRHVGQLEDNRL